LDAPGTMASGVQSDDHVIKAKASCFFVILIIAASYRQYSSITIDTVIFTPSSILSIWAINFSVPLTEVPLISHPHNASRTQMCLG